MVNQEGDKAIMMKPLHMMNRSDMIIRWIERWGFTRIAEVGVHEGKTMELILEACPQLHTYLAVDIDLTPAKEVIEKQLPGRVQPMEMLSVEAAQRVEDYWLDLVFIDADHSCEAVAADIMAWWPKVRDGGILCGHDYIPLPTAESWPTAQGWAKLYDGPCAGVKRAVDDAFPAANLTACLYPARFRYVWWVEKGRIGASIDTLKELRDN